MDARASGRLFARIVVWVQAVALILIGAIMTGVRTVTPWDEAANADGSVTMTSGAPYEIWPVGLALLCLGLLTLAAVLLVEAFGPRRD